MPNKNRQSNKRRHWQTHVKACQESGLTRAEYSRQHNISYRALAYWHKKLSSPKVKESVLVPVALGRGKSGNFIAPNQADLKIIMPGNIKIEIGENFSSSSLVRLLAVLESR
ncbi:MAG: hypothetical protein GXP00_09205 [Alphaproteobacteria bacterium]|nr:hypothetical protein [Alphaproteobacteria bacterium]